MPATLGVQRRLRVVGIVLIAALPSGCAAGGYDADSLHERLVQAGLRPAQATCVIDGMVERFGEDPLNVRNDPIAAETRAVRKVLRKCGVAASSPR